ncbi:hypothetical protein KM043_005482 [Ampulex compressa]|nr:hypothetical protein KM043_005482 [Ampulex compressa]
MPPPKVPFAIVGCIRKGPRLQTTERQGASLARYRGGSHSRRVHTLPRGSPETRFPAGIREGKSASKISRREDEGFVSPNRDPWSARDHLLAEDPPLYDPSRPGSYRITIPRNSLAPCPQPRQQAVLTRNGNSRWKGGQGPSKFPWVLAGTG